MEKKEFAPHELSVKAFKVYSDCDFKFAVSDGKYYVGGVLIGGIQELNKYLESFPTNEE